MKDMTKKNKIIFEIRKTVFMITVFLWLIGACTGCKNNGSNVKKTLPEKESVTSQKDMPSKESVTSQKEMPAKESITTGEKSAGETKEQTTAEQETKEAGTVSENENTTVEENKGITAPADTGIKNNRIVAIDPGHQSRGNSEKEPIGPGASAMKAKVAGGTRGAATGKPEYELTLEISLKLKEELLRRGYTVVMIRETNDVNISNAERAQIANTSGAAAFLRIHADGSENSSVSGATALCPTPQNPYCANIYKDSRKLSDAVLESLCASTGCKKRYVSEVDNMSGINWCQIPVSIVEVGFMTNADEDMLLSTEEYQWKVAKGIADGVDKFFSVSE